MSVLVDTSVWAAYFNGDHDPVTERLDELLVTRQGLTLLPIILTEVLQGFRTDTGYRRARELLQQLPLLTPSIATHVRTAQLFRSLRQRGVTVRGTIDCLIAQVCIEAKISLLTFERDFKLISEHSPLSLA